MTDSGNTLPIFDIVLVNYKTLDLTRVTLQLLKQHFDEGKLNQNSVKVWVVDNDSQDESTQYLRSLDWIHLIERPVFGEEKGFAAHGKALDLALEKVEAEYLFLLHTDTFIYNADVFFWMLQLMRSDSRTAAVGSLHQLNRGYVRSVWRLGSRFIQHYVRKLKLHLGLKSKQPSPYNEQYIKSFCALWNVKIMKKYHLTFFMGDRVPGYEIQDILKAKGHIIKTISPMRLFQYLDHVEAGTVGLVSGYSKTNRRRRRKVMLLEKFGVRNGE